MANLSVVYEVGVFVQSYLYLSYIPRLWQTYIPTSSRPLSARCRHVARSPFALRTGVSPERIDAHQGNHKGKNKRKAPSALPLFRGRHERGRGEKQWLFLASGTQLLGLRPSLFFHFSPLPEYTFWRLALRIVRNRGGTCLHIRGGKEVQPDWLHLMSGGCLSWFSDFLPPW